jgi:peptidoglycan/LPS O-acetylase OafA/YrhL
MEPEIRHKPIRYYEIDLLRFIAAISVVICHFTFAGYYHHGMSPVQYPGIDEFFKYGFLGVELFFIISGYVVLMSAQGKTIGQFFASRVTRLYPAFWVACTICFVVVRFFAPAITQPEQVVFDASLGHYLLNMTMLHAFFGIPNLDGVYWTLTYEIVFYFLITIFISFQWLKHLVLVLAIWLCYCLIAALVLNMGPFSFLFFPQYAPYFIVGMLFFLLQNNSAASWKLYLLLLISYGLCIHSCLNRIHDAVIYYNHPISIIIGIALVTLFFVVFFLIIKNILRLGQSKWLTWMGALTYPIYLCHHNIGYVALQRLGGEMNKYLLLMSMLGAVLLLACLIHVFIERRFSKLLTQKLTALLARA